jgi:two-component system sensor histidine kinase UhpB
MALDAEGSGQPALPSRELDELLAGKPSGLLRTMLNTLPVGVVIMDASGNIAFANLAAHHVWGRVAVLGAERWRDSVAFWHGTGLQLQPDQWPSSRAVKQRETVLNELLDIERPDGGRSIVEISVAPILGSGNAVVGAIAVNQDVTVRVQTEEGLRKTQRLLLDAERLGNTGSWEMDVVTGRVENGEAIRRLFFGRDQTKGEHVSDYLDAIHPDDRERVLQYHAKMLEGTMPEEIEFRVVWPDTSVRTIRSRATAVRDAAGHVARVYGTDADITERKRTEEELARRARQLEFLSRKLIQTQESERRTLANELHDDLGQMLYAIKLNLDRGGKADTETRSLVDAAIARMRDLVHTLRPPLLDEFGLEASLRQYVVREAHRAGLAYYLSLGPFEQRPSSSVEITCFRLVQEALSNVIRHATARSVEIGLDIHDDSLELVVTDDGRGFDVAAARARAASGASQGVLGMRERAALVGGTLEIESATGRGTTVRARLPVTTTGVELQSSR